MGKKGFAKLGKEKHLELSSEGGKKKNPNKGIGSMTPEERSEFAKKASKARWEKYHADKNKR